VGRRVQAEARLQRVAIEWLRSLATERGDILSFHVPNNVWTDKRTAARLEAEGVEAGVADIVVLFPGGRTAFIELKVKGRYQSKAQKAFQATCRALGHHYHLCVCAHEYEVVPQLTGFLAAHGYEA